MNRLTRNIIVHQSADEVLQNESELIDCGLVTALFELLLQEIIIFYDCLVAVS